jgi:hypothetical protein
LAAGDGDDLGVRVSKQDLDRLEGRVAGGAEDGDGDLPAHDEACAVQNELRWDAAGPSL